LKTDAFDYHLPERLIAQRPTERRDGSRLLVVDRKTQAIAHRLFSDLPGYLRSGDCLFRNNAAVIPARLHASRSSGGQVECLLLRPAAGRSDQKTPSATNDEWWCLVRPGKKLPIGASFGIAGIFTATVREKTEDGLARISFETGADDILAVANRIGEMPLPPYIERDLRHESEADKQSAEAQRIFDRDRYQTVYANRARQVAAAAPTAGLHFTPELLRELAAGGVQTADLTLHVGLGTFRPITTSVIVKITRSVVPRKTRCLRLPAAASPSAQPPCAPSRIFSANTRLRSDTIARTKPESSSIRREIFPEWMH
jgi:S-adenosylmethionine:tRNA ribosyltransferase-isomerase